MADGWIALHRKIQDSWLWKDYPFSMGQAWIDLIMLANYEDKKIPYKGEVITCERGIVNLSITSLSERWHWSRDKTRRFLKMLESDGMVVVNATTNRTTITIVNYGVYQDLPTTNNTTNKATSNTTSRQRVSQRVDTTNKDNNINKDNKETNNNIVGRFTPPSLDEVKYYIQANGYNVDAEAFIDFYESKGWMVGKNKMKDWTAAVRTWHRKEKPKENEQKGRLDWLNDIK